MRVKKCLINIQQIIKNYVHHPIRKDHDLFVLYIRI